MIGPCDMTRRIYVVFACLLLFFVLIVIRLFYWQVVSFDRLGGLAERQRLTTIPISAKRGKILSADGSQLVINQRVYGVIVEPYKLKDKDKTIEVLAKELNVSTASISASLSNSQLVWVPIAHKVAENTIAKIKENKLQGVSFSEESMRFYPESSMAAHLLGFVGKNTKGEDQGYFGIEGFYDEKLRGRDGFVQQEIDAQGNPILTGDRQNVLATDGWDLTLYLDKTIQYIVEEKLKSGLEKYGAKGGSIIVLDPHTGGILAMASYPSYDPGEFYKYPADFYKNPAISLSYEPGSTFKVLIMAAALNEGKITPETKFNEDGPVEIGGYTINTWNQKYHGDITMTKVLEYSSNVGMVYVANQLEKDKLYQYIERFGLGNLTGIDLQDEASPTLRSRNKWYSIDYATVSFGQGIAVTPLQILRSVAAIANDGKLMEPQVVKSVQTAEGEIKTISPKVDRILFKPEAARTVGEMMVSAVENGETRFVKPAGYRIAGKTGTAQIPIAGHYDTEKTIASFVGFAPVDRPKFVMLVTLQEPTSSPWGSETAAPLFFSIAKELFSYLKISPSE